MARLKVSSDYLCKVVSLCLLAGQVSASPPCGKDDLACAASRPNSSQESAAPNTSMAMLDKALGGRLVSFTFENQLLQIVEHRVEPIYTGPIPPGPRKQVGVVEVYIDTRTGLVIFADVTQAPSAVHGQALKTAVSKWRFLKARDSTSVLAAPLTFYFISGKNGTRVQAALQGKLKGEINRSSRSSQTEKGNDE